MLTDFIAQLLWSAMDEAYYRDWPSVPYTYAALCAAQHDLSFIWED